MLATSCEELTHWKRLWCWEGLGAGGKRTTEDEMAGWHHWLDGRESEWTLGVGDGQGGLACCDSWCRKESDKTEWLNWTELKDERWEREKRGGGEGEEIQRQTDRTAEVISEGITIENLKKHKWRSMKTPTPSKAAENQKEKGKSGIITDLFNAKGGGTRR